MCQRLISTLIMAGFLLIGFSQDIFAHEHGACHEDEWEPVSAGPLTTWTAPLCGKGKFVLQPFLFYNRTRGTFDAKGKYRALNSGDKKYQFQQQLFAQYGLTDKLEVDFQAVYQENLVEQNGLRAKSNGFGDSYFFARYCAIEEHGWVPHLAGLFQLKIPTGKYQHADPKSLGTDLMGATSGAGSYDTGYGLNLTKKLKPFVLHADLIYSFPIEVKIDGISTKYGNYLNYDFGVEYFLPKGFNLMLEANIFRQPDKKQSSDKIPGSSVNYFTISPGIGWSNKEIQILLAYQRVLTGTNTDANDSVALTAVHTF